MHKFILTALRITKYWTLDLRVSIVNLFRWKYHAVLQEMVSLSKEYAFTEKETPSLFKEITIKSFSKSERPSTTFWNSDDLYRNINFNYHEKHINSNNRSRHFRPYLCCSTHHYSWCFFQNIWKIFIIWRKSLHFSCESKILCWLRSKYHWFWYKITIKNGSIVFEVELLWK